MVRTEEEVLATASAVPTGEALVEELLSFSTSTSRPWDEVDIPQAAARLVTSDMQRNLEWKIRYIQ
eukprot:5056439-Amphidinium_carterae.1